MMRRAPDGRAWVNGLSEAIGAISSAVFTIARVGVIDWWDRQAYRRAAILRGKAFSYSQLTI